MLNYLVPESLLAIKGSGITSSVTDSLKLLSTITEVRLVVLSDSGNSVTTDFPCSVIYRTKETLTNLDGFWYAHSMDCSELLSEMRIKHLLQLHNGDLFMSEKVKLIRKNLNIRTDIELNEEFNTMRSKYVTVISQTKELSILLEQRGIHSMVARAPIFSQYLESSKCYDLVVTGSVSRLKGLYHFLPNISTVPGMRIAVICAVGRGDSKSSVLDRVKRDLFKSYGGMEKINDMKFDWYFGASRNEVNHILSRAKRVLHTSFVECYPCMVFEASKYTTVLTNKYASYGEYIGINTIPVSPTELHKFFGEPLPPAVDLMQHNQLGLVEWKRILTSLEL